MRLLVLGGTHFVGRALVAKAQNRGHEVTTLNRGRTGTDVDGVEALHADRSDCGQLAQQLGGRSWDAVLDTWSGAPAVVAASATLLAGRAGHFGYVSSASVYRWPIPLGADESAPTVEADPDLDSDADYAVCKRGAELAVLRSFPDRALLARAGLILGPYEDVGRLPWWLIRLARGGRVVAPGPPPRPLQLIDARDLADWMIRGAERGLSGAYNTVSPPGHTTMGELLTLANHIVGARAELVWAPPEVIDAAGVRPWTELPIWVPPTGELAALHDADTSAAADEGLRCRPVADTIFDTWQWLQAVGTSNTTHPRAPVGLDTAGEERILALLGDYAPAEFCGPGRIRLRSTGPPEIPGASRQG